MQMLTKACCLTIGLLLSVTSPAATLSAELQQAIATQGPYDPVAIIIQFNPDFNKQNLLKQLHLAIRQQLKQDRSLSKPERIKLRKELRAQVLRALRAQLRTSKSELDALLQFSAAGNVKDLWIINSVALTVPTYIVEVMAMMPPINNIRLDYEVSAPGQAYTPPSPPEWNVSSINVPALWSLGIIGEGVVVAVIDTGVDSSHPDLATRFRGGSNDWLDLHGSTSMPIDGFGHGTNAAGLILAGDSTGVALGMAPGAQWIAARVFDSSGYGTLSHLHAGLQWALDPDDDPATDDAPDIVNNSWGLLETVGSCNSEFQADIQVLKDSGIAVTFAAGNAGPNPDSSLSPANLPGVMSVGALNENLEVARSSSRGPSACDSSTIFPTVSAPGIDVQTTGITFGTGLPVTEWVGGSSFAVAHVSGVMALLKSAEPDASVAQLEQALTETSVDLDLPGDDNNSGAGMIDAHAAFIRLQELTGIPVNSAPVYYFSLFTEAGSTSVTGIPGGVENRDVVSYDPATGSWAMVVDGSDPAYGTNGLVHSGSAIPTNIDALHVLSNGNMLLSFDAPTTVPDIPGGIADESDIVMFNPATNTFSVTYTHQFLRLWNGPWNNRAENIDALSVDGNGNLLVSTTGPVKIGNTWIALDEDVMRFNHSLRSWTLVFDGSHMSPSTFTKKSADIDALAHIGADQLLISVKGWLAQLAQVVPATDEDVLLYTGSFGKKNTTGLLERDLDMTAVTSPLHWSTDISAMSVIQVPAP